MPTRCAGTTKEGKPCRRPPSEGSAYCAVHSKSKKKTGSLQKAAARSPPKSKSPLKSSPKSKSPGRSPHQALKIKDVKWSILLEVPPEDLPSFCATSKDFAAVCRDPKFREIYKAKWASYPRKDFFLGNPPTKKDYDDGSYYHYSGDSIYSQSFLEGDPRRIKLYSAPITAIVYPLSKHIEFFGSFGGSGPGSQGIGIDLAEGWPVVIPETEEAFLLLAELKKRGIDLKTQSYGEIHESLMKIVRKVASKLESQKNIR